MTLGVPTRPQVPQMPPEQIHPKRKDHGNDHNRDQHQPEFKRETDHAVASLVSPPRSANAAPDTSRSGDPTQLFAGTAPLVIFSISKANSKDTFVLPVIKREIALWLRPTRGAKSSWRASVSLKYWPRSRGPHIFWEQFMKDKCTTCINSSIKKCTWCICLKSHQYAQ